MEKSPDAFRTISEAADELDLPQHVLRFWETRFSTIKPLKRGGGRRYCCTFQRATVARFTTRGAVETARRPASWGGCEVVTPLIGKPDCQSRYSALIFDKIRGWGRLTGT